MTILLIFTTSIILLYMAYPVFLLILPRYKPPVMSIPEGEQPVSVILLTYNGVASIPEKIKLLHAELEKFVEHEFIVIDDNSADGSKELLGLLQEQYRFTLVRKEQRMGIPHSMNLGAGMARYETLVFCDQRQTFTGDLKDFIAPLRSEEVGAVSGIISCIDSGNHRSFLRKHENFIKKCESRRGELIGVYGPMYAIRKSCYREIGEEIILDDLFLSLKILSGKRILLMENFTITDDDFITLYNLKRSRRYLNGLLQVTGCRKLMVGLSLRIRIMLLWHKYLRLAIPPLAILCYLSALFHMMKSPVTAMVFAVVTILFLVGFIVRRSFIFSNLNNFLRINIYYFISMIQAVVHRVSGQGNISARR